MLNKIVRSIKFTGFVISSKLLEFGVRQQLKILRTLGSDRKVITDKQWLDNYCDVYGFNTYGEYVDPRLYSCSYVIAHNRNNGCITFFILDWLNTPYEVNYNNLDINIDAYLAMVDLLTKGKSLKKLEMDWS